MAIRFVSDCCGAGIDDLFPEDGFPFSDEICSMCGGYCNPVTSEEFEKSQNKLDPNQLNLFEDDSVCS